MSGASIKVEKTDTGVANQIRAMIAAGQNLLPLHQRIGGAMTTQVELGFKFSRSPYGQAWAPLKVRRGKPLLDTGNLRDSVTAEPDANGVTVGTIGVKGVVHQFGAVIKAKSKPYLVFPTGGGRFARKKTVTIPARPFLPVTQTGVRLPDSYQRAVIARIREHFRLAAEEA